MARISKKNWKKTKHGRKYLTGNKGYVYILSNPSHKYVKIGLTTRPMDKRLRELNSATGVPENFNLEYFTETHDCKQLEKNIHETLKNKRVNSRREFFNISVGKAKKVLKKEKNKLEGKESIKGNLMFFGIISLMIFIFFYCKEQGYSFNDVIDLINMKIQNIKNRL